MKQKFTVAFILILSIFLSGCSKYRAVQISSTDYPPINPIPVETETQIKLFYPEDDRDILSYEIRVVNLKNEDIETVTMLELLKGTSTKKLRNVIPENTSLLSIYTQDSIAYVNFSRELIAEKVEEKEEALIIYSIVNTLTSIEGIEKVQILIEGKQVNFFNRYKIDEPLEFSQIIVNVPYIELTKILEDFYDAIMVGKYRRIFGLNSSNNKEFLDYRNAKFYLQDEYRGLIDYEILDYKIDKYDYEITLNYDMNLYYSGKNVIRTGWTSFKLAYDDNKFVVGKRKLADSSIKINRFSTNNRILYFDN